MDETSLHISMKRPAKILSTKGKKQMGIIASAERGQFTTAICCCNGAGPFITPLLIFALKPMQNRLLDGAPTECQAYFTDKGWINEEIFLL
jgi:hypothetical protein